MQITDSISSIIFNAQFNIAIASYVHMRFIISRAKYYLLVTHAKALEKGLENLENKDSDGPSRAAITQLAARDKENVPEFQFTRARARGGRGTFNEIS